MTDEIKELKFEIEVLKKRIAVLEGIENRRKIMKIIKMIIGILVIIGVIIGGIYLYQIIKGYYDNINNIISNPFDSFKNLPTF